MDRTSSTIPIILTVLLIGALCCLAVCLVIFASGAIIIGRQEETQPVSEVITPEPEPIIPFSTLEEPDPEPEQDPNPIPKPEADLVPVESAQETLIDLQAEIVPINDPIDLGRRLAGKTDIPETLPDPNAPYDLGDGQDFWVTNVDTNENFRISATLRYLGDNVYIWIENDVDFNQNDLDALGDAFDDEIYPTNRAFFGSEWSPGVDGDPRIYIVYAGGLGQSLAGYFSSADELHPEAHEYSNAHEMFLINSDNVYLWEEYIYGTLAHEFQHMIHWYRDKNEETWLNEGFSMLAELINDFDPGGFEYAYIANTDLQLTDWGTDVGSNGPHYGASFLFTTYLYDRFGEEATKAIVAHDGNGMESIDIVLSEMNLTDPMTGQIFTAEDIFADWAVANFLGDSQVADGRFAYSIYPTAPRANPGMTFPTCPIGPTDADVAQFGVDYIEINCPGDHTLTFKGNLAEKILPIQPYSGDYFFWSNMGDHSNMFMERQFDLSDVSGPVDLTFQTWYDLEEDYDYVFVSATRDGQNWEILNTTSCTTDNPSGNSYGCGLNGQTNGWREEQVDLSDYAGENVTIRFDYVTDAAVNGVGMVIDDIRLEAIDYFTDLESDGGGWSAEGFVRVQNALPQTYRLSLITFGRETIVTPVNLDENNMAAIDLDIGGDVDSVVLVVSGTTHFTRQKADYSIEIE
jgi:immune inhibitor A